MRGAMSLGQIVGFLTKLHTLNLHFLPLTEAEDDDDDVRMLLAFRSVSKSLLRLFI
jgi:hypothetical protein